MNFEVFPDYCSTGLWNADTRASSDWSEIEPEALDTVAQGLFAGLAQWNWFWEAAIGAIGDSRLSDIGVALWKENGAKIVAALNAHYEGEHTFVYRTDLL